MNKGGKSLSDLLRLVSFGLRGASCKADQTSFYMIQKNPDDTSRQDFFCNSGSICYGMVDRNHTNSNPAFRFSEKWFCAVVDLPEKL